jgi:hypothetical protein
MAQILTKNQVPANIEMHQAYAHAARTDYGLPFINEADTLHYHEMVKSSDRELFEEAMELEIKTLEDYGTWEMVERSSLPTGTKVLPSTWAFRRKRAPDGTITKRKARFCVRGDLQETEDETYSPVVQASTIRMVMIMALIQGWKCTQCDFVNAFAQSHLKEPIYIEPPKGFSSVPGTVLKLIRSLYGLVTAPNLFYEHLKANLIKRGFKPSISVCRNTVPLCHWPKELPVEGW